MTKKNKIAAKISVLAVCGTDRLTGTSGIQVHKLILGHWAAAKTVEVDFTGVSPSPTFLLEAIVRLIELFEKAEIVRKLKLTGLSAADKQVLNGIVVDAYHARANAEKTKARPQPPSGA